ncbi:LAMI_0B04676g1_1 [Lachancea mirantina]|uniref:assimilatory sulfite reductase (NADPH) n=1 Tax=Lachancea mirantina TaxID=1230905 RepID=A0A1G4IVJ5_9SACH|nr:LAMI_0B04676g1_1 [Lachancea mirantina]
MGIDFLSNPFGISGDWKHAGGYSSPVTAINSVLCDNLKSIFSYKTFSDPDLLDRAVKKWAEKASELEFKELNLRSGAGLTPLGYAKGSKSVSGIITPGYGVPLFAESFRNSGKESGRFLFNVGALDYDEAKGTLSNDYITPLKTASQLGYPVVSPLSAQEAGLTACLALAFAKFGKTVGAVNLFDAATFGKSVLKISGDQSAGVLDKLAHTLTTDSSFDQILDAFNEVAPHRLHNFELSGSEDAETVFVAFGTVESQLFSKFANATRGSKIASIAIRIPLPFDTEKFAALLPVTTKTVVVIGQSPDGLSPSYLKSQVSAALFYQGKRNLKVLEFIYSPDFAWSQKALNSVVTSFLPHVKTGSSNNEDFLFWSADNSPNIDVAARLAHALSLEDGKEVTLRTKFDNLTCAGLYQAQISLYPSTSPVLLDNVEEAALAIVEADVLMHFNAARSIKDLGTLVIVSGFSLKEEDISSTEFLVDELKIPFPVIETIVQRDLKVVFLDSATIGDKEETKGRTMSFVMQAAFWKYAYNLSIADSVRRIWNSAGSDIELLAAVLSDTIANAFDEGLIEADGKKLSDSFKNFTDSSSGKKEENGTQLETIVVENSFKPNPRAIEEVPEVRSTGYLEIAKSLTFSEAYDTANELRPDLPVKNYVVKVKENRRLTPEDYDRYIFHVEFDISGTGMTYGIGEALGIHARNNEAQVKDFFEFYGIDDNEVIVVPNKDNHKILEHRTALQAFIENLDLFGKPPKRFYESLIDFASDEDEKKKLQDLISPAGAVDLKRYQDVEYYTYADVLELFPSVRPSLADLVQIIAPLKRREYSIASSQRMHPNEIHLLIVVVDWVDNKGRKRYGQSSKYISELSVGSELVVSVKPSVMKLPPRPEQPVIMSGLGTGLAPFKAIVEEKLWQKEQGMEIGEVYLFLGSRHKKQEYLYGELWEAYKDAGIITHIGAAFSRDQPKKIYIQDRLRESLEILESAMMEKEGSFYLCGPTWPVPDITSALQDIISANAEKKGLKLDLAAEIEELKEAARYILEVY